LAGILARAEGSKVINKNNGFKVFLEASDRPGSISRLVGRLSPPEVLSPTRPETTAAAARRSVEPAATAAPEPEPSSQPEVGPEWQAGAVDPLALFGVTGAGLSEAVAPPPRSPATIDPLVSELLRSIAWGGDRRRGTARIELGSGRYGGTALKVEVVGERLQIDLDAPPGVDASELGARLSERFAARGLLVDSLIVR
jgi:hypothetical protein